MLVIIVRIEAMEATRKTLMQELKERALEIVPAECGEGRGLVWGEGPLTAKIAIVGEAPGDKEEILKRPFVGPAGKLLDRELEQAGLDRKDVWITNVVKCRPVREIKGGIINRTPTAKEVKAWVAILMEELEIVSPKVIVCAGAVAANALIHKDFALIKERGQWFDGPHGTRVIATFHPAYILRQTGDNWNRTIEAFNSDLKKVAAIGNDNDRQPRSHI